MMSAAAKAAGAVLPSKGQEEGGYEDDEFSFIEPPYATSLAIKKAPDELPEKTMSACFAKQIVADMLEFNQPPHLNLCSFLNTWAEPEAVELITKTLHINMADAVQYPACETMEKRCIKMLAQLWHAPDGNYIGTGTVGSSEACMLGALAMKKLWQQRRREAGLPTATPNLILGHNAQIAWQKFCAYMDVEPRFIELEEGQYVLDPEKLWAAVDDNTIGVAAMFASTYNGQYEDVARIDAVLEQIWRERGYEVPLHVDAANGGLIAPMLQPDVIFDFRLKHVVSINISGHKYGLTYPGCGFVVWKSKELVPQDMVHSLGLYTPHPGMHHPVTMHPACAAVDYLGKEESNLTMNFSRPGAFVTTQYYNFIRLGKDGYRHIFQNLMRVYRYLERQLLDTGHFLILSTGDVPVMAFRLKPAPDRGYDEFDLMHRLKEHQWMVPAYKFAPNISNIKLLRVCLRVGFDLDMCERLACDLVKTIAWLDEHHGGAGASKGGQASVKSQHGKDKQRAGPC